MKKLFMTMILSLIFCAGAYAQTDNQCLEALEKTNIELRKAEAQRDSLVEQIKLKDSLISSMERHIETLNKIIANLDKQVDNSGKMDATTQMIIQNLREELASYKQEVTALRREVNSARKWGDVKMGIGFGAGFLTGRKTN